MNQPVWPLWYQKLRKKQQQQQPNNSSSRAVTNGFAYCLYVRDCWLGKNLATTKRPVLPSVSNRSNDHELRRFTLLYCVLLLLLLLCVEFFCSFYVLLLDPFVLVQTYTQQSQESLYGVSVAVVWGKSKRLEVNIKRERDREGTHTHTHTSKNCYNHKNEKNKT